MEEAGPTVCASTLTLAIIAVVVSRDERGFDVGRVGDGLAEAVSGKRHVGEIDAWRAKSIVVV